jgi:hypothetical protein
LRANLCDTLEPLAVDPSPKFQLYDVILESVVAVKLHVRDEQVLDAIAATGVGGGGGGGGTASFPT